MLNSTPPTYPVYIQEHTERHPHTDACKYAHTDTYPPTHSMPPHTHIYIGMTTLTVTQTHMHIDMAT